MQRFKSRELQLLSSASLFAQNQRNAGKGTRKKWRESLKVQEGDNKKSLGTWIEDRCNAADAGIYFILLIIIITIKRVQVGSGR